MSDRTLKRLRSPDQRPSITDIKAILVAMKPTIIDGQQLIRSAGFDPLSTDPEIVELILCITGN